MPVGVEQWRVAVGVMANAAAAKPQSPIGLRWKKWLKAGDPVVYKGCVVLLVTIAQLASSGVEQWKEKMKKGNGCVCHSANREKVIAMRASPNDVLVTSFLSQLLILMCGYILHFHCHVNQCTSFAMSEEQVSSGCVWPSWLDPVKGVLMVMLLPLPHILLTMKQYWQCKICNPNKRSFILKALKEQINSSPVDVLKRCHLTPASQVYRKTVAGGVASLMSILFSINWTSGVCVVTMIVFVNQMLLMRAGDVERNPGPDMAFTCSNVLRAMRAVENWLMVGGLGDNLYISKEKRDEILQMYSDPEEQKRDLILYWMSTDPWASWRRLITQLDLMGLSSVVDGIRDFAEPLAADASLTVRNIYQATLTLDCEGLKNCLDVPYSVYHQIRGNPSYPNEEKEREAIITYFLNTVPLASWATLVGEVYYMEEPVSLEAVRKYLNHTTDSSFTLHNLNTALETLPDEEWDDFGAWLDVPDSKCDEIKSQYNSDGERKSALFQTYLTSHPAPSWQHVANALYRCGASRRMYHTILDRVQRMFPSGRYRAKLIYDREMKHGHSDTDVTKVVMMGIAGSGKSTALGTIMEEEPLPKEDRHSTPIMKRPVKTMVIVVDGKTKWIKKEQDEFTAHLAKHLDTMYSPPQETTPTNDPPPPNKSAAADISLTPSVPDTSDSSSHTPTSDSPSHTPSSHPSPNSATASSTTPLVQADPSLSSELSVDSLLQTVEVDQEFVSLISQATGSPKPSVYERWVFLIDSGGQTEFQDAFSVFLPHTSVCVFVFKLSESLDNYPDIMYYRNGKLVGNIQQSLLTNRDIFEKYMRTMFSFNSRAKGVEEKKVAAIQECSPQPATIPEKSYEKESSVNVPPRILLLGTHRDLKHLCETETVEQKNKQLEAVIPEKLKKQVIYADKKRLIFEINGLRPDDDDKKMAEKIRTVIMEKCPSRREKTPWRWHVFNQKMKSISRHLGRNILSREECLKIAESVELDKESFELALEFFHNLSIIFYYPAILPDVVFVDPQVLLDKVTEFVEFKFELQEDKDCDSAAPCLPLGWQQFERFAQVTDEFLEDKRFSSHYHKSVFTRKHLTTLLEKLLVFARLSPDTWFMPCVLKHLTPQEISKYCVSHSPLVVHFPDGGPQHGVCCSLIAHILSTANQRPSAWAIRLAGSRPACLYRNCIQFQVPGYGGFVMLIDRYTFFEIHVHTIERKLPKLWEQVRSAIMNGIDSVSVRLGYSDNKPSSAILCPIHTETPRHPAPIRDGEWICSSTNDSGEVIDLEECVPWMETKVSTDGDTKSVRRRYSRKERATGAVRGENSTPPDTTICMEMNSSIKKEAGNAQGTREAALADGTVTLRISTDQPQEEGSLCEDDLVDVTDYLMNLNKSDIYNLGLVLGLSRRRVVSWGENCRSNQEFLDDVVGSWLQKEDRVKEVSWKALVEALRHPRLGHNGIATSIAMDHGISI